MSIAHYRRFLRNNGYPVPADERDVVHTVRAVMKVRFPLGWSGHYERHGGVLCGFSDDEGKDDVCR